MKLKIDIPTSKSYGQRAIIAALLCPSRSVLRGVELSGDIASALSLITQLGAVVEVAGSTITIDGVGSVRGGAVSVGESGLLARMVSVIAVAADDRVDISGEATLLRRPLHSTLEALDELRASYVAQSQQLPIRVTPTTINKEEITIDGSSGSQTLTGLLFLLPLLDNPPEVVVKNLKSRPYIDITIDLLSRFGITVENQNYERFILRSEGGYSAVDMEVERDWSGAGYFLVASHIYGVEVEMEGLNYSSCQGDRAILGAIELARGGSAIEFDATDTPDLFPALVSLCATLDGVSKIKGLGRLRGKESDRGEVLKREFAKLGVRLELDYNDDILYIYGAGRIEQQAVIDPEGDHRIAMATAIMGRDIRILTPEVVDKSFAGFWQQWSKFLKAL